MKRFSKNISSILLVALIAITLVGCSSTAKTEAAPEIVVSAPAPVVEPAPAPAPEPAPTPAPEPAVIISGEVDYAGFKASVAMGPTEAVAEFPVAITFENISAALSPEAAAAISGAVSVEDGKAVFTYPELSKEARFHTAITTYRNNIAISCCEGDTDESFRVIASKAADKMLTLAGIEAAFTLVRIGDQIHISGRSNGNINVQLILEKLNGGGHFDVAGAQVISSSVEAVLETLKGSIDDYLGI